MYYHPKTKQHFQEGLAFVLDGVQYPPNWLTLAPKLEKVAIGLTEVQVVGEPINDGKHYVQETLDGAIKTITNIPIEDTRVADTAAWAAKTEATAYLASTDWYIIRSVEAGKAVPDDVLTKRAAARLLL